MTTVASDFLVPPPASAGGAAGDRDAGAPGVP